MYEDRLLEKISSDEDEAIGNEEKSKCGDCGNIGSSELLTAPNDVPASFCPMPPPQPIFPPRILPLNLLKSEQMDTFTPSKRPNYTNSFHRDGNESKQIKSQQHASPLDAMMDFDNAEDWLVDEEEEEGGGKHADGGGDNDGLQQIFDSPFWTQSIAPGKFYTRVRNGGQIATPALVALQQQFGQKVIGTIRTGQAAQPRSEPPPMANFHRNCGNCKNHAIHSPHDSMSDGDEDSSGEENALDHSSSSSSSITTESDEEGQISEQDEMKKKGGRRRRKRRRGGKSKTLEEKNGERRGGRRNRRRQPPNMLAQKEIERKRTHPAGLHMEIGFNEPGQLNDGPMCKCSWAAKQTGVRHGKYQGEEPVPPCDWQSSNIDRLHHYVLQVEPDPAQSSRRCTQIQLDGHSYQFDGFSVFFHQPLPERFPQRPINQWTQQFQVRFVHENAPESFTVADLELFHTFLFDQILELYDLNRWLNIDGKGKETSCPFYHCLPRFARKLPDNGKELLPMSSLLAHFVSSFRPLVDDRLCWLFRSNPRTLSEFGHTQKGQICINPTKKPMAIRVDLLDSVEAAVGQQNNGDGGGNDFYPTITHFGVKPSAYAYSKRPHYQEALRKHVELAQLLAQKAQPLSFVDKRQLRESKANLAALKNECKSRRDTLIHLSSRGFYSTGIYPDMVQHALLLVLACQHVRFHCSLGSLEQQKLGYTFKNRALLELALIHPSFRSNYGTNPDHAKNVLNNCGIRISKTNPGDVPTGKKEEKRGQSDWATSSAQSAAPLPPPPSIRRKGIHVLMEVMAMQGSKQSAPPIDASSLVRHNERMEFLGDTVVEFLTTVHLYFLFTELDEGGLATFRSALVQNRHLATLADRIGLQHYMVYAHGPDLCHEADLRHAMANTFEALMAAVFLDAGLAECDRIFGDALFKDDPQLLAIWNNLPEHPLKHDSPYGDRHLIDSVPCLQLLAQFEQSIGIRFKHIRLLAKAFTRRNIPFNYLTLGHNQRLEFLGDTVLQLLTSDYLYRHFPHHQEGHLSLLRTCLVSNRTQSVVCDDLAMARHLVLPQTILRKYPQAQLRVKDKADLVESFLGALYVDRGLRYCHQFCRVCFFPRLKHFIVRQSWNDPKSQLQQCCLTLRDPRARGDPDIPKYKTIGIEGPTNTRLYRVAVYFRKKRLAVGCGASVHLAQMDGAKNALAENGRIFPNFCRIQPSPQHGNGANGGQAPKKEGKGYSPQMEKNSETRQHGGIKRRQRENGGGEWGERTPVAKRRNLPSADIRGDAGKTEGIAMLRKPTGFGDESYWSPRLNAIHEMLRKSSQKQQRQQQACPYSFAPPPAQQQIPSFSGNANDDDDDDEGQSSFCLPPPPPPPQII